MMEAGVRVRERSEVAILLALQMEEVSNKAKLQAKARKQARASQRKTALPVPSL